MALNLKAVDPGRGFPWRETPRTVQKKGGNPRCLETSVERAEVVELCRARSADAVHVLVKLMAHKGPHQFAAATAILDRAWGKPTQHIETSGNSVLELHLIAARAVSEALTTIEHEVQPEDVNAKPQSTTLEIPTE